MNSLQKALQIAKKAHKGQYDKAGHDYISHPLRITSKLDDKKMKIVAILHDVLEDSNVTVKYLTRYFTPDVVSRVMILTRGDESYKSYLKRVKADAITRLIKIYDLQDNMDLSRLSRVTERDIVRTNKYLTAYKFLQEI